MVCVFPIFQLGRGCTVGKKWSGSPREPGLPQHPEECVLCGLRVPPLLYRSRKLVVCHVQKETGHVHGGSMDKSKTREEAPTIPRRRGGGNMKGNAVRPQGILFLSERNFRLTGKTEI